MNNTAFEELLALAAKNSRNCLTDDIVIEHVDNMGLSMVEISRMCDKLVDEGIRIVSQSEYDKAVEDYRVIYNDPVIEEILKLFRTLSPEKQNLCYRELLQMENNWNGGNTNDVAAKPSPGFIERLQNARLQYSYIAVLVRSFFELCSPDGSVSLDKLIQRFGDFYIDRIENGMTAEKQNSLVYRGTQSFSDFEFIVLSNPLKRSFLTDYYTVDKKNRLVTMKSDVWEGLEYGDIQTILSITDSKLKEYYCSII